MTLEELQLKVEEMHGVLQQMVGYVATQTRAEEAHRKSLDETLHSIKKGVAHVARKLPSPDREEIYRIIGWLEH